MCADSRVQSSRSSCKIQRLSIQRYRMPSSWVIKMASWNDCGSVFVCIPAVRLATVFLFRVVDFAEPQQWLRVAYSPDEHCDKRTETSDPELQISRILVGSLALKYSCPCSASHLVTQFRIVSRADGHFGEAGTVRPRTKLARGLPEFSAC